MNTKPATSKDADDKLVKNIRRKTRQIHSAEENIRNVLAGLRGEESISALCRRENISESLHYRCFEEFPEAGKRRLSGDPTHQATSPKVSIDYMTSKHRSDDTSKNCDDTALSAHS